MEAKTVSDSMNDSSINGGQKKLLALVAIMRDEQEYLLEWVAYYNSIGIRDIYIYDNGGNGSVIEILELIRRVKLVQWPTIEGVSPQLSAYNHAVDMLKDKFEFVCFFDADEFLVIKEGLNLEVWLQSIPKDIGAIFVNQRAFGSSLNIHRQEGLVIERFCYASAIDHDESRWGKSFYRLSCVDIISNSHRGTLNCGRYTFPNFTDAKIKNASFPQSEIVEYSLMQLNHYILKSAEEFRKKRIRGGVSAATEFERKARYTSCDFFNTRDKYLSCVIDSRIVNKITGVKQIIDEIKCIINDRSLSI